MQNQHTIDLMLNRRSVRKFQNRKIPWDNVVAICNAGLHAPQAGNVYNNKIIVVKNIDKIKAIAQACHGQSWIATAPVVFAIVSEPDLLKRLYGTRGERLYTIQNAAAVTMSMIIATESLGLASCWVGVFDEAKMVDIFGLSPQINIQAIIPIGFAAEKPNKPTKPWFKSHIFLEGYWSGYKIPPLGHYSLEVMKAAKQTETAVKKVADNVMDRLKEKVLKKKK